MTKQQVEANYAEDILMATLEISSKYGWNNLQTKPVCRLARCVVGIEAGKVKEERGEGYKGRKGNKQRKNWIVKRTKREGKTKGRMT